MASSPREFALELNRHNVRSDCGVLNDWTAMIAARDAEIAREASKQGQIHMRKRLAEYVLSCKEESVDYVQVYEVMANNMMEFMPLHLDPPAPAAASAPEVTGNSGYDDSDY
jgi:hypothetical protein